jgi:hypothetical protein
LLSSAVHRSRSLLLLAEHILLCFRRFRLGTDAAENGVWCCARKTETPRLLLLLLL